MDTAPPSYFLVGDSVQICQFCLFKIILSTLMRPPLLRMLPLAAPLDTRLSSFPPLPPPAACRDVRPSININIRRRPQLPNSRLPTVRGSPRQSTSSIAAPRVSIPSPNVSAREESVARSVTRPVHSVGEYNRLGLAACDDRSGSVSRLIVRY